MSDYTSFMAEQIRTQFALNLISLRKKRGFSQTELAAASGISQRMIAYYETQSVIPPLEKLEKLASTLNAAVSELVDPNSADTTAVQLNTRILKKVQLLEQLPTEDQKKVMDYAKDLLERNQLKRQHALSTQS